MSNSHTYGPWQIDNYTDSSLILIYGENGDNIAEIYHDSVGAKALANAQLISAAPDLLEACKSVATAIMTIDLHLFGQDPVAGHYYRDELMAVIDTAIAKAKGDDA